MKNWRSRASTGSARRASTAPRCIYTARISVRFAGSRGGRRVGWLGGGWEDGEGGGGYDRAAYGSPRGWAPCKFVFRAAARGGGGGSGGGEIAEAGSRTTGGEHRKASSSRPLRALPPVAITDRREGGWGWGWGGRREGKAASGGARATRVADPGILLKFHTRRARSSRGIDFRTDYSARIPYTGLYTRHARASPGVRARARARGN